MIGVQASNDILATNGVFVEFPYFLMAAERRVSFTWNVYTVRVFSEQAYLFGAMCSEPFNRLSIPQFFKLGVMLRKV